MTVSVINPIGEAFSRTGQILFKPFSIKKWFILGFCAFLAHLTEGGGSGIGNHNTGKWGKCSNCRENVQEAIAWIEANLIWLIAVVIAVYLVILAFVTLFLWLECRGRFMFIDGIALNRPAVIEPWKSFRGLANSLLGLRLILTVIGMLVPIAGIAVGLHFAWPDIEAWRFGDDAIAGIIGMAVTIIVPLIILWIVDLIVRDFVVPTMYLRGEGVMNSCRIVRDEILLAQTGSVLLYFLMRIFISIAVGFIAVVATCATLCLTALPYIGTVILLPLYVFKRCYSLCYLEQFGPAWRVFFDEMWPASCAQCGCDFKGSTGFETCPECGAPVELITPGRIATQQ